MGNLLRVLNDRGSVPKIDFFVDFESKCTTTYAVFISHPSPHTYLPPSLPPPLTPSPLTLAAQPTPGETMVHGRVATVLSRAPEILTDLRNYEGAGEFIREVTTKYCITQCTSSHLCCMCMTCSAHTVVRGKRVTDHLKDKAG